jgi:tyrosine-protein phosphatase SIW14
MQMNQEWLLRIAMAVGLLQLATGPVRGELNIQEVSRGVYYGEAPSSAADYQQLQCLGIKTVLDMRKFSPHASAREEEIVSSYGMLYRHVPMGFQPTRDCTPEEALQILADPALQPVYMHCNLGRDRTGLVVALYRVRYLGWSSNAAYEDMQRERFNPLLRNMDRYFRRYAR